MTQCFIFCSENGRINHLLISQSHVGTHKATATAELQLLYINGADLMAAAGCFKLITDDDFLMWSVDYYSPL